MNSYNAFIVGELVPTNLTQDNLQQINPADVEEMDILLQMTMEIFRAKKFINKYDWSDQVQELEMTLSNAFMTGVDEKSNEVKSQLSKTSVICEKYDYSSKVLENMVSIQYREKKGKCLGYQECEPPFNHNYSSMPRINTSVDELVLQSDHAFEFPIEPVSLTVDTMFVYDDSEVCADSLILTGLTEKEAGRSAGRSTDYSTSSSKSHFVPNTYFVGIFETIKI
ncbi:hypothetical protein R6Q57_008441 [Mikania cordata]